MKEEHTHTCIYEYINMNYACDSRLRFVALYDDNGDGLFCINFLEGYTQEEIEIMTRECADEIANCQFDEATELMENLIQMSDYQLCKWLFDNIKHFENCEIKESSLQSNGEYDYTIGAYRIKVSPEHQDDAFIQINKKRKD